MAEEGAPPPSQQIARQTAAQLLAVGMTRQAYAELVREAARTEEETERAALQREAGALLWQAGAWEDAARHFSWLGDDPDARLGLAYSLYRQGRLLPARSLLQERADAEALYLDGLLLLRQGQAEAAVRTWRRLPADSPLAPRALEASSRVQAWGRIPRRSPAATGTLSALLPGLGQASLGRWGEAASALIVNGLLIGGTVEMARRELWAGAGLLAFFELGFYGGNVMSAVNGARRFNRRALEERVAPLEQSHGLVLEPTSAGWSAPPANPGSP